MGRFTEVAQMVYLPKNGIQTENIKQILTTLSSMILDVWGLGGVWTDTTVRLARML